MSRLSWLVVAAGALAFAAPAPARAAVDLGPGSSPSVVVDAADTAHIVYETDDGATYCRLPRGAKACAGGVALPLANASGPPFIVQRPDGVLVVTQATDDIDTGATGTWIEYSTDGGGTFSAPLELATGLDDLTDVAAAPDSQSLYTIESATAGLLFQQSPFSGGQTQLLNLETPVDGVTTGQDSHGRLAVLPDGRIMVVDEQTSVVHWRFFGGGNPLDPNAWAAQGKLTGGDVPDVVSGPRGTYALALRSLADQELRHESPFALRSFDASKLRWRPAKAAGEDIRPLNSAALFEDPRGRLHVVSDTDNTRTGCIVYSRTSASRKSWFGRSTTLFRTTSPSHFPQDAVVAAGADGRGVVAWDESRVGHDGDVWVTPLRQASGRYHRIANAFNRPECPR